MTDYNWSGWAATAAKSSGGPTLEPGDYSAAEVVDAGAKPTRNGQPLLWFRFKILVGPQAGETETLFQNLNPENPKALAAFYGVLGRLGVDFSVIPDGTPPEAIAKTVIGRRFSFEFAHRADEKTGRVYAQFNNLVHLGSLNTTAPAVAVPAAVVAAVVEAAAVPVTEALAPAPDSIEAQIAALQAQQAAAAAAPVAAEAVAAVPAKGKLPF